MDEIITAVEEEILPDDAENIVMATVTEVSASGLKILIDGEETASDKLYKCNKSVSYQVGDRVKISRVSGSILVDYVIGFPSSDPSEIHGIPSGGSAGQALTKRSATNYDVQWADLSVSTIANSTYSITLDGVTLTPQGTTGTISLGSSTKKFKDFYLSGSAYIADASGKIGFFGHTPATRQTVASSATVAQLITALKAYGLIY